MQNVIRVEVQSVVGVDLGDRFSHVCCLARETGAVLEEKRLSTTSASFQSYFESRGPCLVVVESGGQVFQAQSAPKKSTAAGRRGEDSRGRDHTISLVQSPCANAP